MIRLCVLYHDDTREPVAVESLYVRGADGQLCRGAGQAGINLQGGVYGSGRFGKACAELLASERERWATPAKGKP